MRLGVLPAVLLLAVTLGCGNTPAPTGLGPTPSVRTYNGTASVGDFLSISIDSSAHTITYTNHSNSDTGTISYTSNADGTYALADPTGNFVAAYEVPSYALLVQATKTGPNHATPALITAVATGTISSSTWANSSFNYMQFRTAAGGLEVGSVSMDANGSPSITSYWPFGAISNQSPFHQESLNSSLFQRDSSGTFMRIPDDSGTYDYVFGTANGVFAVDTPNGAILGLKKASSKTFDSTFAGTYKAIYYEKNDAATGSGNVERGTPSLGRATVVISTSGQVTVQDSQGNTVVQTTLTPVADAPYIHGPGQVTDPCYGLFTFRITTATSQQDVFVTFMDRSLLFASFRADLPWSNGNTYDYLYGVGLK